MEGVVRMKNYAEQQPLVVSARLIAYALVGASACLQKTNSIIEKNAHIASLKEYQALLETFGNTND
jgi:hypothetical protein